MCPSPLAPYFSHRRYRAFDIIVDDDAAALDDDYGDDCPALLQITGAERGKEKEEKVKRGQPTCAREERVMSAGCDAVGSEKREDGPSMVR